MAEDLYTQWLGLPPGERPPDYYTLLGVERFDHALPRIEQAARAKLDALDKYSIHPDREKRDACQRMMNEVAVARVVLTDPQRRSPYDEELAAQLGIPAPIADDVEPEADVGLVHAEYAESSPQSAADNETQAFLDSVKTTTLLQADAPSSDAPAPKADRFINSTTIILGGLVILGLITLAIWIATRGQQEAPPEILPPKPVVVKPPTVEADPTIVRPQASAFHDEFERDRPGFAYELENAEEGTLAIAEESLAVNATQDGPVRLLIKPSNAAKTVTQVQFRLKLESMTSARITINRGATFAVAREGNQIKPTITPGEPDGMRWPLLYGDSVLVNAKFAEGTVTWTGNGVPIGTNPLIGETDVPPRIRIVLYGQRGLRAWVDDVDVWYE